MSDSCVRVALRVRPLLSAEIVRDQKNIISYPRPEQVSLADRKTFTYDYVFKEHSLQCEISDSCVTPLLDAFLDGYNATIIAYGQTGSGKTFTMGTLDSSSLLKEDFGVVPNFVNRLYDRIESTPDIDFTVRLQFCEVHNDCIKDLLCRTHDNNNLQIREFRTSGPAGKEIKVMGLTETPVDNYDAVMQELEFGSLSRATGSTNMNAHSSRSHAVFTITLTQVRRKASDEKGGKGGKAEKASTGREGEGPTSGESKEGEEEEETLTSKFHFVDLAGSERLKRTGAVGERLREGININSGLLALGNVISALGDPNRKGTYVPFRDSKITRLLEGSLGGNSKTLMIACISPAADNFDESLNSLKYANRARNIKNKPVINRDPNSAKIERLRDRIKMLENALSSSDRGDLSGLLAGSISSGESDNLEALRLQNSQLDAEVIRLTELLKKYKSDASGVDEKLFEAQKSRDILELKLTEIVKRFDPNDPVLKALGGTHPQESVIDRQLSHIRRLEADNSTLSARLNDIERKFSKEHSLRLEMEDLDGSAVAASFFSDVQLEIDKRKLSGIQEKLRQATPQIIADAISSVVPSHKNIDEEDGNGVVESKKIACTSVHNGADASESASVGGETDKENVSAQSPSGEADQDDSESSEEEEDTGEGEEEEDTEARSELEAYAAMEREKVEKTREHQRLEQQMRRVIGNVDEDIRSKQALIDELLKTRKQCLAQKELYQSKIRDMEFEMRDVEAQRDKVLGEIKQGNADKPNREQLKKHENKLKILHNELRNAKLKLKANQNLIRAAAKDEVKIKRLRSQIDSFKKQKVAMSRRIKEEESKFRLFNKEMMGKIRTFEKKTRKMDYENKKLQSKLQAQYNVLKRKTEEQQATARKLREERKRKRVHTGPKIDNRRFLKSVRKKLDCEIDLIIQRRSTLAKLTRLKKRHASLLERRNEDVSVISDAKIRRSRRASFSSVQYDELRKDDQEIDELEDRADNLQDEIEFCLDEICKTERALESLGVQLRRVSKSGGGGADRQMSLDKRVFMRVSVDRVPDAKDVILMYLNKLIEEKHRNSRSLGEQRVLQVRNSELEQELRDSLTNRQCLERQLSQIADQKDLEQTKLLREAAFSVENREDNRIALESELLNAKMSLDMLSPSPLQGRSKVFSTPERSSTDVVDMEIQTPVASPALQNSARQTETPEDCSKLEPSLISFDDRSQPMSPPQQSRGLCSPRGVAPPRAFLREMDAVQLQSPTIAHRRIKTRSASLHDIDCSGTMSRQDSDCSRHEQVQSHSPLQQIFMSLAAPNTHTPTTVPETHSETPVVNHGHQPMSRTPANVPDTNHGPGHQRSVTVFVPPSVFDRLSHPSTFTGSVKSQFSEDGTPTVQHTYEPVLKKMKRTDPSTASQPTKTAAAARTTAAEHGGSGPVGGVNDVFARLARQSNFTGTSKHGAVGDGPGSAEPEVMEHTALPSRRLLRSSSDADLSNPRRVTRARLGKPQRVKAKTAELRRLPNPERVDTPEPSNFHPDRSSALKSLVRLQSLTSPLPPLSPPIENIWAENSNKSTSTPAHSARLSPSETDTSATGRVFVPTAKTFVPQSERPTECVEDLEDEDFPVHHVADMEL
eukprot:166520_1